jgi:hypothetical protein
MSDVKWITTKSGKKFPISESIEKDNDTKEKQISDNAKKVKELGKMDKLNKLKTKEQKEKKIKKLFGDNKKTKLFPKNKSSKKKI